MFWGVVFVEMIAGWALALALSTWDMFLVAKPSRDWVPGRDIEVMRKARSHFT
jgi:hypothetical protein